MPALPAVSAGPAAPLLRLDGVSFRRGRRVILDQAALTVGGGEIVTLIGPNGAGKSTLVKIALNLLAPDAGVVARAPGLRIGYVPQHTAFDPTLPLTVRRFLDLARGPAGAAAARRALAQAGAADLRNAPLQSLSGGEFRRVLLARALLREPDLLILDEPGAGMDLSGQVELYRLFQAIRARRHCAILLVSHDLYMVMAATDRVFCLNRHLCCSGQPEDVRRHPEFVALFGARAASELAVYQHHHDHEHGLHGEVRPAGDSATLDGDGDVDGDGDGDGDSTTTDVGDGDASAMTDVGDGDASMARVDDGDSMSTTVDAATDSSAKTNTVTPRHG